MLLSFFVFFLYLYHFVPLSKYIMIKRFQQQLLEIIQQEGNVLVETLKALYTK